jgi:hypothetical protein
MEKLSGILPNSPRVKSVDVNDAKPRRPGAPTFGLPNGTTAAVRDRVSLSKNTPNDVGADTLTYKNPKDFRSVKISEDMAKNFFETRLRPTEPKVSSSEVVAEALGGELGQEAISLEDVNLPALEERQPKQPSYAVA